MNKITALMLLVSVMLVACGQSGPLYLPNKSSPDTSQDKQSSNDLSNIVIAD